MLDLRRSKWLWLTIFGCIATALIPWLYLYVALCLTPPWGGVAFIAPFIAWGVFDAIKDWYLNP